MSQVDIPEQIEVGSADITGMQMLQVIWSQVACWKRKLKILKRYDLQIKIDKFNIPLGFLFLLSQQLRK